MHCDAGVSETLRWSMLMKLLVFWCISLSTDAEVVGSVVTTTLGSPIGAPRVVPRSHRAWGKRFMGLGSSFELSPTQPPLSSHFSRHLVKRTGLAPSFFGFKNIAPSQSDVGVLPSGLAQPPLSPSVSSKLDSEPLDL